MFTISKEVLGDAKQTEAAKNDKSYYAIKPAHKPIKTTKSTGGHFLMAKITKITQDRQNSSGETIAVFKDVTSSIQSHHLWINPEIIKMIYKNHPEGKKMEECFPAVGFWIEMIEDSFSQRDDKKITYKAYIHNQINNIKVLFFAETTIKPMLQDEIMNIMNTLISESRWHHEEIPVPKAHTSPKISSVLEIPHIIEFYWDHMNYIKAIQTQEDSCE